MSQTADFPGLIANPTLSDQLMRPVRTGRIAHAQIFAGPRGTGKRTAAGYVSRALNCQAKPEDRPCGMCSSCKRFESGNHPNLIRVTPDKLIKVDEIRDLVDALSIKPFENGYHIVIMENADRMNAQAQNALLKTLEDPPEKVVFFLLTDRVDAFLPTIVSRCRVVRFHPISDEDCARALTMRGYALDRAKELASLCQGSVGRAIEIDGDAEYASLNERVIGALTKLKRPGDVAGAFRLIAEDKDRASDALEIMERTALRLMREKEGYPTRLDTREAEMRAHGLRGDMMLRGVILARMRLNANVSWQSVMEMLFFSLTKQEDTE